MPSILDKQRGSKLTFLFGRSCLTDNHDAWPPANHPSWVMPLPSEPASIRLVGVEARRSYRPDQRDGRDKEVAMATLVAIGYPDETTALSAMDEAERLQHELIIQADAIAAIVRNKEGKIRVVTNHHAVGAGATWGMFWGMLFGMLFFVPFLGMAVGAGMGALMGKVTKNAVDREFQDQVREMLQPGTSALFMVVEKVTPDKAVEAMSKFGGTVLKSSLSKEAESELQEALHGEGSGQ
jgi:uncharacterized membrane protein